MKFIERLKNDKKFLIKVILLGIGVFLIPYITIPALLVWWFVKSTLSKKTKIIIGSGVLSFLMFLVVLGVRAYNKDVEPHLSITEPQSDARIQSSKLTVKGTYDPADRKVWVNGKKITTSDGSFEYEVELKEGKNEIKISAGDWKRANQTVVVYRELTEEEKLTKVIPTPTEKPQKEMRVESIPTPTPTKEPVKSFTEAELTEDSVKKEIEKLSFGRTMGGKDLELVEIISNVGTVDIPDDKIIELTYYPKSVWDEKDLVKKTADTTVSVSEALFKHPKVSLIRVFTKEPFTDQYGKENIENAVKVGLERTTADKIDWNNFKNMVLVDYNKLLQVADYSWIHPAIRKSL